MLISKALDTTLMLNIFIIIFFFSGYNAVKSSDKTPSPFPPSTVQTDFPNTILEPQVMKSEGNTKAHKRPAFAGKLLFVGVFPKPTIPNPFYDYNQIYKALYVI